MLIKNGLVLHFGRLEAARDVRLAGDKIVALGASLLPDPGEAILDASGCYV